MKHFFLISFLAAALLACNNDSVKQTAKENIPVVLNEKDIYAYDSVKSAVDKAGEPAIYESKKMFLKAIDLYHNKQDAAGSIGFFKRSICYNPDARAYFQLGNALIDSNKPEEAISALEIAGNMEYDPLYAVYFAQAGAFSVMKDTAMVRQSLESAFGLGFSNKDMLLNDKRFTELRELPWFASFVLQLGDDKKMKERLYAAFIKSSPEGQLPFIEPQDSIAIYNHYEYINYDFAAFIPGMEDGRYSRDVTNEYLFVNRIALDNKINLLVYKTVEAIADTLPPVLTNIMTYDSTGNTVDELLLSCACSPLTRQYGTIDADKNIHISYYNVKWRDEPTDKGYAQNAVIGEELQKEEFYIIEGGRFIKKEQPVQETASSESK